MYNLVHNGLHLCTKYNVLGTKTTSTSGGHSKTIITVNITGRSCSLKLNCF